MNSSTHSNTIINMQGITATYRIDPILKDINWHWQDHEQWAFLGGNGAGKSALAQIITEVLRPQRGTVIRQPEIATETDIIHLDFQLQRQLIEHDIRFDDSNSREDANDIGTTVKQAILQNQPETNRFMQLAETCNVSHILDHGIRFISTGESRKTLLARALYANPKILILDNPLEGLDTQSQVDLINLIKQLVNSSLKLLLLINQRHELPDNISHVAIIENGKIIFQGARESALKVYEKKSHKDSALTFTLPQARNRNYSSPPLDKPLIKMEDVTVSYGDKIVLHNVSWKFNKGQHCAISGPNGAGKSTLLSLICGDNHKAYGQKIDLFGNRRGSGESIWEIKEKFGVVNTALQLSNIGRMKVNEVVASGLYDTVGLYQNCTGKDRKIAQQWLKAMDLEGLAQQQYQRISFGQQRLTMLARAMVKSPLILILDEPCLGLDEAHRHHFLTMVDAIANRGDCHILYVSHTQGEMPDCINQHLKLIPDAAGGYTVD